MSKTVVPIVPGIAHARIQSHNGPRFGTGECLMQTELAMFGRHGFGGDTAFHGWSLTKHKHEYKGGPLDAFIHGIPRGFPVWFAGGTPTVHHPEGAGHVIQSALPMFCWSVDRNRDGFWDRVPTKSMFTWNASHPLRLLGWSEDIGGVSLPYKPHSKDAHR